MKDEDAILTVSTHHALVEAFSALNRDIEDKVDIDKENLERTPLRIVGAYEELFWGLGKDPAAVLQTSFPDGNYDEMVTVCNIDFVSVCAHHLLPFTGYAHFAYLPDKRVVGLSKIPRMIDILARRPQIQENLTRRIVDVFQQVVEPRGCAVLVDAWHACVAIRGARKPRAMMRTTALTGWFLERPHLKREFFDTIALEIRR